MNDSTNRNLPPNWSWVKLGDVYKIETGNTPPKKEPHNYGNYIPFIKPPQLLNCIVTNGEEFLSRKGAEKGRVLPADSILVSCIGNLGKIGLNKVPVAFNQQINALVNNPKINSRFTYYFCQSKNFRNQLESVASATTIPIVNKSKFSQLTIPLPPLTEQKKIVEKIEELFSGLDSGVASLKKAKEQIRLYRQSVLASAFSGKLFEDGDYNSRLVKDVFELIDGDRGPKYPKREDYRLEGYCLFLSTKNVRPNGFLFDEIVFITEKKHKELRKGTLSRGDIVLTTRGTVGNVAYYDESIKYDVIRINSGMLILRMKEQNYLPKFVIYYVQSPQFDLQIKEKVTGTAQPQLPANVLKEFVIPYTDLITQTQIVSEIEKRFSEADNLEKAIDDSLEKSEALRQSILKQAFEGKLV